MTAPVELLQQIGLSKYEAEAYYTLLAQGPLTGYEVGKRSQVPLSRSYEILERLQARGLAFVQPGDPPRYLAQDPARLLGQVRTTLETTLQALATELAALPARGAAGEFWVVRGRQPVLERARTMIAEARGELAIALPSVWQSTLAEALTLAHTRGCRVRTRLLDDGSQHIMLLRDETEALIGTLAPGTSSTQAVVSANEALIAVLRAYFKQWESASTVATTSAASQQQSDDAWLAWEERKQQRLWQQSMEHRVA